jgi:hypothetical protein
MRRAVAGGDQLVEHAVEHEQQPLRWGSGLLDTLDQAGAAQLAALGDLFGPGGKTAIRTWELSTSAWLATWSGSMVRRLVGTVS